MASDDESAFVARAIGAFANADVVSFDVFDTVLERTYGRPIDVFEAMTDEVRSLTGKALGFRAARVAAEREARRLARSVGRTEITLDAIYDRLAEAEGWTPALRDAVAECELSHERGCLRARPLGRTLFGLARNAGKRIVFASDMYLPASFVERVLRDAGYASFERVFVSSELLATKSTGAMYEVLVRELGVPAARILHIGDNARADVESAERHGLVSIHVPRAEESLERVGGLGRARRKDSIGARAVASHVARTLFDVPPASDARSTPFAGDPYRLGVQGMGPLLLGLAKWLVETAIERGYGKLYFLARDGKIMLDAYRIVARAYANAPEATYLLCSRRAANVASIRVADDLESRALPRKAPSTIAEFLSGRFGLEADAVPSAVLERHGMTLDTLVSTPDVARVSKLLTDLAPELLHVAKQEREAYLAYLRTVGIAAGESACVVDIGYRGTMQASIDELLGGVGLAGLYLLTLHEAEDIVVPRGLPIDGYLGRLVDSTRGFHALGTFIPVYETLFSGSDTSLVRFRMGADGPTPIFMPEDTAEHRRVAVVSEVHRGALALVENMVGAFGPSLGDLAIRPDDAIAPLDAYLVAPDAEDARILEGIPFENAYCAAGFIPVVAPRGIGESMWPEGSLAVRHGANVLGRAFSRVALGAYASPLVRAFRVAPKLFVHAVVGSAMSTADARAAVKNPIGFARERRRAFASRLRRLARLGRSERRKL